MICSKCHNDNLEDSKFCIFCGAPIAPVVQPARARQEMPEKPVTTPDGQERPAPIQPIGTLVRQERPAPAQSAAAPDRQERPAPAPEAAAKEKTDGKPAGSEAPAAPPMPVGERQKYVVLQVNLKEKPTALGVTNIPVLEQVINQQAAAGYRLHSITNACGGSLISNDRLQATVVFERID